MRFIEILSNCPPEEQIKIVGGVFEKYPPSSFDPSLLVAKQAFVDEFQNVIKRLKGLSGPASEVVAEKLREYGAEYVHQIWRQAVERKDTSPEAAITSARTLLESVCKHVLDDLGIDYGPKDDLPKLYRKTSEGLNLAPDQHGEEVFKQILGGCKSVVEGLGAVRNRLGDAHGQGRSHVRPASRHAELAVNLAGAMSLFLIQTFEHRTLPDD